MNSVYEATGQLSFRMSGWEPTVTCRYRLERHLIQVVKYQTTHFNATGWMQNHCRLR